ncbi:hypothetical protein E3V39_13875 [Gammaproteobacteria bacterium LSUCC0112]|nr:hypothetical protein E3V39_13875 [Gammaproteobacteria bacterium LSUCC0112]
MKKASTNQHKRYGWAVSLSLIVTFGLGALWAYEQRHTLAIDIANELLSDYQIDVTHIDGLSMGLHLITVDTIEFRARQSPDIQTIQNLELQFDAFDLISGNIKSLTADQVNFSVSWPGGDGDIRSEINTINIACQSAQHCSGSAQLLMDISAFDAVDTPFRSSPARVSSAVDFRYAEGRLSLSLPAGLQTSLDNISCGDFQFEQIELLTRQHWQLEVYFTSQSFSLSADSTNVSFNISGAANAQTSISNISVLCSALDSCDIQSHVDITLDSFQLQNPELTLTGLGVVSDVTLQYRGSTLAVILPADLKVFLEAGSYSDYRVEQLDIVSQEAWQLSVDLGARNASVATKSTMIKLPVLRTRADTDTPSLSGMTIHVQALTAFMDFPANQTLPWLQQLSASAKLEASQIYTTLAPYNFWPYQWSTQLQWSNADQLQIKLDAKHAGQSLLSINLDHSVSALRGAASFKLEALSFSPDGAHLSSYLSPLPVDADLLEGTISLEGNVGWHADPDAMIWQPEGQLQVDLQALAGFVDEIVFSGLSASSRWTLRTDGTLASQSAFPLSIREIDPGIPLFNVQSLVSVDTASGLIHLQTPNADVFGGTVSADRIDIFLPRENRTDELGETFEIAINAIDIAQVVSLSAYEQVSATGIISGVLPVRFKGLKPVIEAGQLSASQQGGSIRYDQGGTGSGNQNLDLVYQALEHYQYDTLSAGVDFDEEGELTLALQMQGQSPNVGQGQRINLNLNITDNIPALLQSLQAADNMAERLQDMLE